MGEYIKREDVLKIIDYIKNKYITLYNQKEKRSQFWFDTNRYFEKKVRALPKENVEKIVHCTDCRFSKNLDRSKVPYMYFNPRCVLCTNEAVVGDEPMVYLPYHFCSYGDEKN